MKRRALERHLRSYGCVLDRRGTKHDIWVNPETQGDAPIPRHNEIRYPTVRSVCRLLGVPLPRGR